jgi:hypothetical protein
MPFGADLSGSSLEVSLADDDIIVSVQEGENPYSGIQSFDNIYYAALQVVVVTSANGVRVLCSYFCRANFLSVVPYHVLDHRC